LVTAVTSKGCARLVVAAHAKVPWVQGGFVGVDVFFVLSGYLITGLLVDEIDRTGGVRMLEFYARRLRRLLPALLLMIAGTCAAAVILLAPFEQASQAPAAGSASLWLSNLHFAFSKLDYFGPAAESNLFLHTWSLGVEEQFYLLWPALVLFLLGAWQWQGKRRDFRRLQLGMLSTVAICLALGIFLTYTAPSLAFYTMPARAWQFALGALVVLSIRGRDATDAATGMGRLAIVTGWIGLGMIIAAALLLGPQTPYPGAWALLPSVGAAAVLLAGAVASTTGISRVLATRRLQQIGRVSYAWYLWHWPVLLLGATLVDMSDPLAVSGLVVVSLLLAMVSYWLVEAPLRRNPRLVARPAWTLLAGIVLMAGAYAASSGWQHLATDWEQSQHRYQDARDDLPALYGMGCDDWFSSARVRACYFGPEHAPHTVVLMGDSIGAQWFPAIATVFDKPGWTLLVLTKSSCPMVDVPYFYERIGRRYVECETWRRDALVFVRSLHPEVVVLGSSASYPFTAAQWIEGTTRVLDAVRTTGGRSYIIQATPTLPFDGPACLSRSHWRARLLAGRDDCGAALANEQDRSVRGWIAMAAARSGGVRVLDLQNQICPNARCQAERNGTVVFRDGQHLTAAFVRSLSEVMAGLLDESASSGAQKATADSMPQAK